MNKYLPVIVAGFGAAVLSVIPILKNIGCCLIVPIASILALFLDYKVNRNLERITVAKSVGFGFLTGLFTTFFFVSIDLFITYLSKSNDIINSLPHTEIMIQQMNLGDYAKESVEIMKKIASEIRKDGFSFVYMILILLYNFISNSIFGIIGGLIGMNIVNRKIERNYQ